MTLLKTKQIIFFLDHLTGLSTMCAFTRQTEHEKWVFVSFCYLHTNISLQTFLTITLEATHFTVHTQIRVSFAYVSKQ